MKTTHYNTTHYLTRSRRPLDQRSLFYLFGLIVRANRPQEKIEIIELISQIHNITTGVDVLFIASFIVFRYFE